MKNEKSKIFDIVLCKTFELLIHFNSYYSFHVLIKELKCCLMMIIPVLQAASGTNAGIAVHSCAVLA